MSTRRRIAVMLVGTVVVLFVALAALPLLFRDRIAGRVKVELGERVDARVDWAGVGISVFRDFPNVTFGLEDVVVTGIERFEGDTLLAANRFRLVLDLGSVLRNLRGRGPLVIRSVALEQPVVRLTVLEDGAASWDILRGDDMPADSAHDARALEVSLRDLAVSDAAIVFDDRQAGLYASLAGLEHSLSGDFSQDRFTLETKTHADSVSLDFAGVPYLNDVALDVDADIDADMEAQQFTLADNRIQLNDLVLDVAGMIGIGGENLALDLTFETPGTEFGDILSLVPAIYAQDFAALQTSGTMSVAGHVRGEYGPLAFPSFALNAQVENGTFRYPDLPQPARDISVDLSVTNAGGDADSTVVELRRFHAVLGDDPMDATLVIRTPVSDPDVDVRAVGTLDLANVGRTVKLENVEELTGVIAADFTMRARQSDIDRGAYERVDADGRIDVSDFAFASATLPHALNIAEAHLQLSPRHAELTSFRGTIGSSDLQGSGRLENLLGFALRDEDLRGSATVHSAHFDLNEWRSDRTERPVIPVPPHIDFTLDATAERLTYGTLDIADARGGVHIRDERITLDDFRMDMLGGSIVATGFYETTTPEQPTFDVDLHLAAIDIPGAFTAFTTVQTLAPVARYAQGSVTADVTLNGAIGENMVPLFDVLTGIGSFETTSLILQDFPAFARLADALKIDRLRNPGFAALASSFEIRDGRLHVKPFDAEVGPIRVNVAGSNGIDRSLAYTLNVELPRSVLGAQANGVLASLASKSASAGIDPDTAERVTVGVNVTGTVTEPALALDLSSAAGSVREGVQQALRDEVDERANVVEARVDSAAAEARRKAADQSAALVAEAQERAAAIREEARALAESVRREGHAKADSLEARATNPVARIAAQAAANRLRSEADATADRMVLEADARAEALITEARQRAGNE